MRRLWQVFKGNYRRILYFGLLALVIFVPLYPKFPLIEVRGSYVPVRLEDIFSAFLFGVWFVGNIKLGGRNPERVSPLRPGSGQAAFRRSQGSLLPSSQGVLVRRVDLRTAGGLRGSFSRYGDFLGLRQVLWEDKLNRAVLVFWVAALVSLASAIWVTQTVGAAIGFLHWFRRVEYMGLFFVARDALWQRRQLSVIIWVLVLVVIGAAVFGLGQIYLGFPVISTQNVEFSKGIALRLAPGARLPSTFAGHYDLSAFCVLVMPLLAGVVAMSKRWREKLTLGAVWVASLWLLLESASRISYPAALAGMWVSLVILRKFKWIAVVTVIAIVGLSMSEDLAGRYQQVMNYEVGKVILRVRNKLQVLVPAVNLVYAETGEGGRIVGSSDLTIGVSPVVLQSGGQMALEEPILLPGFGETKSASAQGLGETKGEVLAADEEKRIKSIPTPEPAPVEEDRSSSIRINVEWPRALRAFKKNPLLGTGMSSMTLATDNDYLRLLGEVGLVGFLAFALVFLRWANVAKKAIWRWSENWETGRVYLAGTIGIVLGILINATFIDVFEASKVAMVFWIILGGSVAAVTMGRKEV